MRKNFAVFAPMIAAAAIMVACTDPITQPGDTAGAMPLDTLLSRSPVDTFYSAQRAPSDTFAAAPRMPLDTFAVAPRMPLDTFAVAPAMPLDTLY